MINQSSITSLEFLFAKVLPFTSDKNLALNFLPVRSFKSLIWLRSEANDQWRDFSVLIPVMNPLSVSRQLFYFQYRSVKSVTNTEEVGGFFPSALKYLWMLTDYFFLIFNFMISVKGTDWFCIDRIKGTLRSMIIVKLIIVTLGSVGFFCLQLKMKTEMGIPALPSQILSDFPIYTKRSLSLGSHYHI